MKRMIVGLAVGLIIIGSQGAQAADPAVPGVLAFQGALFDDGGNPIPDGPAGISFRVLDAAGAVLYEERQTPDVVRGELSALVGNGLTAAGAPTGGIPDGLFAPGAPRYLQVEVDGQPPTAPLEIASVPYALHAGLAQGVVDGGVAFEDFEEGVVARLAAALADAGVGANEVIVRGDLATMYRDPASAAAIGVEPVFAVSSSTTVQGVLADIDRAIPAEAAAREAGDAAILAAAAPPNTWRVSAWCHVASCLSGSISATCGNAGASRTGPSQCRVTFGAAMAGGDYAVVTTPALAVPSRDAGGFTVDCGNMGICAFDFIAIAP